MCGIAGFLDFTHSTNTKTLSATVSAMASTLHHRGPDDHGVWVDAQAGIALGFQRLAIMDLSTAGRQPIVSSCGRYVLVYNGEIYNGAQLRKELENLGRRFRGHCDSEILLEACAEWGLSDAITRIIGMFAFALWDREERTLALARDRLGIKPLYWGHVNNLLLFGSELKALKAHGGWKPEIDRDSLASFIRHQYVPTPHSIYQGINKLKPGHIVTISPEGETETWCYWDLFTIARKSSARHETISEAEALEHLEDTLRESVRCRMVADVPLGAFLSGGIDSSLVVALMQAENAGPVRTFAVGFHEAKFDEAPYAKAVAQHLGTDHTEIYVTPEEALEIVPRLPEWYDEPFADPSQIPTMLLSRFTRHSVTVALSGDGGDEVFGGYKRHYRADALRRRLRWLPHAARHGVAAAIRALPCRTRYGAYRRDRIAGFLSATGDVALYRRLVSYVNDPAALVPGSTEWKGILWSDDIASDIPNFIERAGYFDTVTSLSDQMLTKVDRASMAVSLEVRVPLLDHRLVEFAWQLPPSIKYGKADENKRLLRAILYKHVPRPLVDRRKQGFGVPVATWLRGPLKEWAEDLLNERRLSDEGFFDARAVRIMWEEHQAGLGEWQRVLWRVLMFEAWKGY